MKFRVATLDAEEIMLGPGVFAELTKVPSHEDMIVIAVKGEVIGDDTQALLKGLEEAFPNKLVVLVSDRTKFLELTPVEDPTGDV